MTKELKKELKEIEKSGNTLSPYMVSITFKDKPGYENIDCETLKEAIKVASRKDIRGLCIYDAKGTQLINDYIG